MNQELKNVFRGMPGASAGLEHRIIAVIAAREARRAKVRVWTLSAIGITAAIGTVPAVIELATHASQSGSFQYLSLAFSGGLASAGRDVALAFIESLPLASILICLAVITVALWSGRAAFKQNRTVTFKTV
jgi:hypothetical protein